MNQLFEEIIAIFRDTLDEDDLEIRPEMTFAELEIDSLDLLEVVTAIELKYGIEIPDEQLKTVKTVEDAFRVVDALV